MTTTTGRGAFRALWQRIGRWIGLRSALRIGWRSTLRTGLRIGRRSALWTGLRPGLPLRPRLALIFATWALLAILGPVALPAAEPPAGGSDASDHPPAATVVLPRRPAPSPDGGRIAFSYQGDLWLVPAEGGDALRLTAHPAYESDPVWSPDGGWIAFSSDRDGNADVFVLPVGGGEVRRLTWHSADDLPCGWTSDGRCVLFNSARHVRDTGAAGLYAVPLSGGAPAPVLATGASDAEISPDGTRLVYVRSGTNWWRRGYEGSARARLWLFTPENGTLTEALAAWATAESVEEAPAAGEQAATNPGLHAAAALLPRGEHRRLTPEAEPGPERDPHWLPDGKRIVCLAESSGVANLRIVSVEDAGRAPLTRFREGRLRLPAIARNGSLAAFEYEDRIWTVRIPSGPGSGSGSGFGSGPPEPPRPLEIRLPLDWKEEEVERLRVTSGAEEMALSPDGEQIAFVRHGEIFVMRADAEDSYAHRLTDHPARDHQVAWWPDSRSLLFVSDREGSRDIWRIRSADPTEPRLARALRFDLERITSDPREEDRPAPDPRGTRIAFTRGGTLLIAGPDGGEERVLSDGWSPVSFRWSPDGRWLAFVRADDEYNDDVWIVSADGREGPHNVSQHPADDTQPAWSPDGRVLAFVSQRRFFRQADVWYVPLTRAEDELSPLDRRDRLSGGGKPDGADGPAPWGEPSEAQRVGRAQGDPNEQRMHGEQGDRDELRAWEGQGESGGRREQGELEDTVERRDQGEPVERRGEGEQGEAGEPRDRGDRPGRRAAGEKANSPADTLVVRIDFDGIERRARRLTSLPGAESEILIARDGGAFLFVSDTDGKRDLWKVKWDGSEPKRLTSGGADPSALQLDPKGKKVFYLKGDGGIVSVGLDGGEPSTFRYEGRLTLDLKAQRATVFDEAWRVLRDRFYDPGMHGVDWPAMRDKYRPWALAASSGRDFQDAVRLMLGELNASHLGISGPGGRRGEADGAQTGELGVIFDPRHPGPGLRILRVIPETPADRVASRLFPGDLLLAVNGEPVERGADPARLLDGTVDRKVLLTVRGDGGRQREVALRPCSGREFREALDREAMEARRRYVDRAGGGRLAYLEIESMDIGSLEEFERELYAVAHGREALLIDVRGNPGGWITDLLLASLLTPEHAQTVPRGGRPAYPQDRRLLYAWTKPIVVLCDEYSYSNAEIFSWAVKTLKRGPVVGRRTYGAVISTGGMTLLDGSSLRLPGRGWITRFDGSNQEGTGCPPDIEVENRPGEIALGIDRQLEAAVAEGLRQLPGR